MQNFKQWLEEAEKQRLDPKCWDGYKKQGTKVKGGVRVNNCVKEDEELKYCPKCKKLETRSDCAYGGEYWDNNAKEVSVDGDNVSVAEAKKYKSSKKSNLTAKMFRKMAGGFHEEKGMEGMTQKGGHKRSTESGAGLTQKGVEKYRRQNPGSKLQTAVTTPPSKLKPGSKAAKRRKSFCARSKGWTGERGKAARRRWNC